MPMLVISIVTCTLAVLGVLAGLVWRLATAVSLLAETAKRVEALEKRAEKQVDTERATERHGQRLDEHERRIDKLEDRLSREATGGHRALS